MSVALTEMKARLPPSEFARVTCGSKIPSGKSPRTADTASRTSFTARSMGVPMSNATVVVLEPLLYPAADTVDAIDRS